MSLDHEKNMNHAQLPTFAVDPPDPWSDEFYSFPASFGQRALWLVEQLNPGSAVYNMPLPLRIVGKLDVAAFEKSLNEVIARHEALRTRFVADEAGELTQQIAPSLSMTLPIVDLAPLPAERRSRELDALLADLGFRPFALDRGPLCRFALIRLADEEHILHVNIHHAVFDGHSHGLFLRELIALYEAFVKDEPSPLQDPPLQYADFAHWQREQFDGDAGAAGLAYWKRQLSGAPPFLDLRTDMIRPKVLSARGGHVMTRFSGETVAALRAIAESTGSTMFMVVLAAVLVLLERYSGQQRIVIGTAVANRAQPELEEVLGFFVNMVPICVDLGDNPTFVELCRRVRDVSLDAFAHQDTPFDLLASELVQDRDPSRNPIFQAVYSYQPKDARSTRSMSGLAFETLTAKEAPVKFEFIVDVVEVEDGLGLAIDFSLDLWREGTILRMLQHARVLIEAATRTPARRIADLPLLTGTEREEVLSTWNRTHAEYPRDAAIGKIFSEIARRHPKASAMVHGEVQISYGELERRANRLAHHLLARGMQFEEPIGVCLQRSTAFVVTILAILKAGGAYVPLDPSYPDERLSFMLQDAGCRRVLGAKGEIERFDDRYEAIDVEATLEQLATLPSGDDDDDPGVAFGGDQLAYVIYTSGSTGRPKGVMVSHRGVQRIAVNSGFAPLEIGDTMAHLSNVSFDAATWEIWGPLLNGARVAIFDKEEALSGGLGEKLRAHGVTAMFNTTALFNRLADDAPETFASLRHMLFGGELVDVARVRRVLDRDRPARLLHVYGPTECVTYSSWYEIERVDDGASTIPIGRGVNNLRLYVLDRDLNPAPVDLPGDLYVAGDGLARGYAHSPGFSASRFVPDPFSMESGGRMYRTGDIARWNVDGRIEFVGRVDNQVKIRGFRIEPGEIEALLREHSAVKDAIVLVKGVGADKHLVAYVAAAEKTDETTLRAHLRGRLPDYMQPSALCVLEALPLSPGGKVDRAALPEPSLAGGNHGHAAPRDPVEEGVAALFCEVLGRERVGIHDHFFELGGHSLLATRLVSRVRATFGIEIPLRSFFESPTVASLAHHVAAGKSTATPAQQTRQARQRGPSPLSYTQEGLWFLYRMQPHSSAYNITCTLEIEGDLDVGTLEKALRTVVERHDALRTVFTETEDGIWQHAEDGSSFSLTQTNLLDAPDLDSALAHAVSDETARPFNLEQGPIFRATLLRAHTDKHALVLAMHHIVSDGWSIAVIMREVEEAYAAYRNGEEPRLPELAMQYADYAVEQREKLRGPALEALLSFWVDAIGPSPAELDLPIDGKRAPLGMARSGTQNIAIPPALDERMRRFCEKASLTPYMFLLAVFQLVLQRYSGQDQFLLCTPVGNRPSMELEQLVGFFVNTIVLPADLRGDPTFMDLVARVKDTAIEALSRQELPFEKLVARINPARDARRNPLTQVMFILQNQATHQPDFGGLRARMTDPPALSPKFDLTLAFVETDQGFVGSFEFDADLFTTSTIEGMARAYVRLLDAVLENPTTRIGSIPLLVADERRIVIEERSVGPRNRVPMQCVHRLFEKQVERTPEATAVLAEDAQASYAELNARANPIARLLRNQGVDRDVVVGVCLDKSVDLYAALLGVWKAGGVYMPLHPDFPDARLRQMMDDSGAKHVVTSAAYASRFAGVQHVDALDALESALQALPAENLDVDPYPDNLAYVLYTSGSTGRPKGVMLPHGALSNFVPAIERLVAPRPEDRILQFAAISFDVSMFDILSALLFGATLVCGSKASTLPGSDLVAFVKRSAISILILTPSALAVTPVEELPKLRLVAVGGEASQPDLVTPWSTARSLLNYYGPTETTVSSSIGTFVPGDRVVSIGPPLENETGFLLDGSAEPVSDGVPGELYIGGAGVGRGYLGRPGLTAERFVPDPFGPPGARMYRTGDRVRRLPDGAMEYLGRLDQQVKIRGFRIELGEIESALSSHPTVRSSVVLAREDVPGDKRLVAYVVPNDGECNFGALREHLGRVLPDYMVPAVFVALKSLPLTPNGKVDRRSLPTPDGSREATSATYLAPTTPTQQTLVALWEQLLGVKPIGITDDFFTLGGHSLLAVRLMSAMKSRLGHAPAMAGLFQHPTIEALARLVDETNERPSLGAALRMIGRSANEPAFAGLSGTERRLWFLNRLHPEARSYQVPMVVRVDKPLDDAALRTSIDVLVKRHELLRTAYPEVDGAPVRLVSDATSILVRIEDVSSMQASARDAAIQRLVAEEVATAFDLARGPLMRVLAIRLSANEHVLVLHQHHIITDEWSGGVLLNELFTLYEATRRNESATLPALVYQYADYARAEQAALDGDGFSASRTYWKDQLRGLPRLDLPILNASVSPNPGPEGHLSLYYGRDESQALRELASAFGCTQFMAWYAAFCAVLARCSGQTDFGLGAVIAARELAGTESMLGFFTNTVVLRTDLAGDPTFRQLLERARQTAIDAYKHQALPFDIVVQDQGVRRRAGENPLYEVSFFEVTAPAGDAPGWSPFATTVADGVTTAKDTLSVAVHHGREGTEVLLSYDTSRVSRIAAERLLQHLKMLVVDAVAHPDKRLSDLSLLTDAEQALLGTWNDTARDYPADDCIHELFEEQVVKTPDAVAVVFENDKLTYSELNARANQLAHYLRSLGVGPEVLVGLCVERSLEMVIGLLAILKAGGAYVPLDPMYPADRIAFMLDDARVNVLLTQARLVDKLPRHDARVVRLDADALLWAALPEATRTTGVVPENAAYVIYTSGSTGRPKGVVLQHVGGVVFLSWVAREFDARLLAGVIGSTSISFDVSFFEIFAPLTRGGTLLLVRDVLSIDALEESPVPTLLVTVPSAARVLAREKKLPRTLRAVNLAGEPLDRETADAVYAAGPGIEIVRDLYGPTEDTTYSTCAHRKRGAPATIGRPLDNGRTYVVGSRLESLFTGVPGELLLAGAGLARSYLNRPGLTAERFVPDPFSNKPGARMYRTGDLARWNEDGQLEFLGRMDHQVKIRGFRIELGEIELALAMHASVRACVVLAREDVPHDKRLVAYVVPNDGECHVHLLREHLGKTLPDYMIPSAFVTLESLPLTPNGKVDRKALPAPDAMRDDKASLFAAHTSTEPETDDERVMCTLWAEALRTSHVRPHDDFFHLGGHSLSAVVLMSRISRRFGRDVPITTLFSAPTPRGLLQRMHDADTTFSPLVSLNRAGSGIPVFWIHPIGGNVFTFKDVARYLGKTRPSYGLQAYGLSAPHAPLEDVGAMADRYIEAILAEKPEGPFTIAGYSMGGLVAFEIARRLVASGRKHVPQVLLLDTMSPVQHHTIAKFSEARKVELFTNDFLRLAGEPEREVPAQWDELAEDQLLETSLAFVHDLAPAIADIDLNRWTRLYRVFRGNLVAASNYEPERFPGTVVYVRPRKSMNEPGGGFGQLAAEVVQIDVAGDHYSMLREPNAGELARILASTLDAAGL